jgi:two-component sensor histidine kinase
VAESRFFVAERAPDISPELRDVLMLLTSELVTNAVIHARTALEVGITVTNRSVVVTVHDEDLGPPEPDAGREGGWGLGLVSSLAVESDMERHAGDGKTAWFRITRDDDKEPAP